MGYSARRGGRYAVPAAVVAAIAGIALVPSVSGASTPSGLVPVSPAQLLVDAQTAKAPQLSGALAWTANLGLSDLSSIESEVGVSSGSSSTAQLLNYLSGTYDVNVWLDGAKAEHFALATSQDEEVDVVRNGDQAWVWDSADQTATHIVGEAAAGQASGQQYMPGPLAERDGTSLTPQELAARLLSKAQASTSVSTGSPVYVAGEPAYQLLVAPRSPTGSTIAEVAVDVAASSPLRGDVLQVAVYAAGQAAPALELGYTGVLHPGPPPAAELEFTPPPGAKVVTRVIGGGTQSAPPVHGSGLGGLSLGGLGLGGLGLKAVGSGWTSVLTGSDAQLATALTGTSLAGLTTVVTVGGQSARLLSSALLNLLVLPHGRFYAGFVTPAVLEVDASAAG